MEVSVKLKFKLIAALLGLGLTIVIPGAVIAQNDAQNDQSLDQDSQAAPAPSDQTSNQGSIDQGSGNQSYTTPAPAETNGVTRVTRVPGYTSKTAGASAD